MLDHRFILSALVFTLACQSKTPEDGPAAPSDSGDPAGSDSSPPDDTAADGPEVKDLEVEGWSLSCVSLRDGDDWLAATGDAFGFTATGAEGAARFFFQPSDLATYLLYDAERGYLVAEDGPLTRETRLESDVTRVEDLVIDDDYVSGAEWILEPSAQGGPVYQLRSRRHDRLLGPDGLVDAVEDAAALTLEPAEGCAEHPELSLDAAFLDDASAPTRTTFDDGDLYGVVDTHSHILSNFGFGGGIFHGGAFHRLGVEHALPDCALYHGEMGRQDFFGYAFDGGGNDATDLLSVVADILAGELSEDNHATDGYPTFSEWPDARNRATHQQQYHRWLERAWMAGLRLVVQHATTNSVICNMTVGEGYQASRYDCEDMTAVDRIIDESWQMQRYIDARAGGAGQGWFRIVESPAEARAVIEAGKMAVILGIETSDLFDCHITPRLDGPVCDEAYVEAQLDAYYARGVRALFPVHKYDNQFTPGDGSGDFIELGNFLNSGHWTNMTESCPEDVPTGFDNGGVTFGGLLQPRDDFLAPAPNDHSGFPDDPLGLAVSYLVEFLEPSVSGDWCQNATMTPLGESLLMGMMSRGMIIEVDHLPQWSYQRAFELLEEHDYPAAGTHGRHWDGRIYAVGGTSKIGIGRCRDTERAGAMLDELASEVSLIESVGGYPAVGFGFDLNGFAGAPAPRFAEGACGDEQTDPVTYPFTSFGGDVEFSQPTVGERVVDFGQEGMVHIGVLPELLEDARGDAASASDLEPLFRSAEAYIRMWEKAERRAAALGG